jgi:hypothetical protein
MHNEVVKENSKSAIARPQHSVASGAEGSENDAYYQTNPAISLKTNDPVF